MHEMHDDKNEMMTLPSSPTECAADEHLQWWVVVVVVILTGDGDGDGGISLMLRVDS